MSFSFVAVGTPASLQSKSKRKVSWKATVSASANIAVPSGHNLDGNFRVEIIYGYSNGAVDLDNMIKPILDALDKIVYHDD